MSNLWERQPYETSAMFNAFHKYYLAQEPPRSVDKAFRLRYPEKAEKKRREDGRILTANGTWWHWAMGRRSSGIEVEGSLTWRQRAQAYDDHLASLDIEKWQKEHMSGAEVLARLAKIARVDLGDFKGVASVDDLENHPQSGLIKTIKIKAVEGSSGRKSFSFEIIPHDALKAIELIGRHLALFIDKVAPTDPSGEHAWNPLSGLSNDELDAELERLEQGRKRALSAAGEGEASSAPVPTARDDPEGQSRTDPNA